MIRIDSHQHFWQYSPAEHVWMSDAMQVLKKNFSPSDLQPLLQEINFDGCIAVQARQSIEETNWLLQLAKQYNFIKGVVGWVDLRSPEIHNILTGYKDEKKLVGVRHVLHDEADDNFMLQPAFQNGIAALKELNLTYDLLLFPKHLPVAVKLVEKFPEQPFILDHIAKPLISKKEFSPWKEDLLELAKHPNVYCKLSGMVTESEWNNWKEDDFKAYLDIVTAVFGTNRVMIGSDWPVCTLSGSYSSTMNIIINYASQFSQEISDAILGHNCIDFYKINCID
jgi:L-fuconolactonase